MPCAICESFIPSEDQVYTVGEIVDGDGRTVYILRTMAGTEKFRVATLDVETISKTLALRDYRIKIMEKGKVVCIIAEELRWRYCEAEQLPDYIKKASCDCFKYWYFICEKCRYEDPDWEHYPNINYEGIASSGSEDAEDDSDSMIIHFSESDDP